ncbi:hypothetical protein INR49_010571 [Caranx melampygus]|nr:hypothetical protein INR49_010571 [Caranx melampygus]
MGMQLYLSSIQVVCNLEHKEENSEGLLLDGVSLPVLHNGPTQRQQRVSLGQLAVLRVAVQDRAQLQVSPGLDPRGRFELKHRLQTVDAQTDLRRTRRAEMFCKAQQGQSGQ